MSDVRGEKLFESPRLFQLWAYTVSHSWLLLRSTQEPGVPTRIDVCFGDVAAIHLPRLMTGLSIIESSSSVEEGLVMLPGVDLVRGRTVFHVSGPSYVGYVIASFAEWHEDDGQYYEPSYFARGWSGPLGVV
jgi:hypothetical protein